MRLLRGTQRTRAVLVNAADLANEATAELAVVENERDDLKLRLDEAESTVEAARRQVAELEQRAKACDSAAEWSSNGNLLEARANAFRDAARMFDQVEGL